MPDLKPPINMNQVKELTSFIGNTKDILEKLFDALHPAAASERQEANSKNIKNLDKMIKIEARVTRLNNDVHQPIHLVSETTQVQSYIDHLKTNGRGSSALQMSDYHQNKLNPLKAEVTAKDSEHTKLLHEMAELVHEKDDLFKQLINGMAKNEKSPEQIAEALKGLDKRAKQLKERYETLNNTEKSLHKQLNDLRDETFKAAQTTGIPVEEAPGKRPESPGI